MEEPVLLPVTPHTDLFANAHLASPVRRVNMTPKPAALFTATTGEPAFLARKVQSACALLYLLDLNANSLLTVRALQIHATMVARVKIQLRRHTTIVSVLPILSGNDATSWIVVCKKKSVEFLNAKS